MKKRLNLFAAMLVAAVLLFASCSETEWGDVTEVNIFPFERTDTTISYEAQEFTVLQTNDWDGWEWKYWRVYTEDEPNEYPNRVELEYDEQTGIYTAGWIRVKIDRLSTKQNKFTIWVDKNTTTKTRSCLLSLGADTNDSKHYYGSFYIHQLPLTANENKDEPINNILKVRYHGKVYQSEVTTDSTGALTYANKELQLLLETLSAKDGVEAVVSESDVVTYLDADNANDAKVLSRIHQHVADSVKCPLLPIRQSRADAFRHQDANALAYFALYDDTGFKDTEFYKNITQPTDYYDNNFIKSIGLNDKVSSLAVGYNGADADLCAVLVVWEDSNYNNGENDRTKHRISIVASKDNPQVSYANLKKLPCINAHDSWNDRISSISFHIGYFDSRLKDY